MNRSLCYGTPSTRQRGAISILTACVLVLMLTVLALVVDTGRLYLEQRNLQKIVDMAALDTSARLPRGYCAGQEQLADQFALESAALHDFAPDTNKALNTQCATITIVDGLRHGSTDPDGVAVEVQASHRVPASLVLRGGAFFSSTISDTIDLTAKASAQRSNAVAAFSVGSQLLRLNNDQLVGQLLGAIGLDPSLLTALDANGIANATITPSGLLKALGVEVGIEELALLSPSGLIKLVNTQVGLIGIDELVNASAELVSTEALSIALTALKADILDNTLLGDTDLTLLGSNGEGLIQLALGSLNSTRAALESSINLGELLSVALLTGTSQHAIEIDSLQLLGISVAASITEPPALAVGPVGTTAYTGQLRLHVDIDTDDIPVLGLLTSLLGTRVHLPLTIDVTSAQGELTALQCQSTTPTANIEVTSTILNACIGSISEEHLWSGSNSCGAFVQETELITLLGAPVLSGSSIIEGLEHQETLTNMSVGETRTTQPNTLQLGDTVNNLVLNLLDLLGGLFRPPQRYHGGDIESTNPGREQLINDLAQQYLDASKDSAGFYNVEDVKDLILEGSAEVDENGQQVLPPLTEDWQFDRAIPTSCALWACAVDHWLTPWKRGSFSDAFHAYTSTPYGVLDVVGIPTLGNGYQSCAGLLSSLLNWNGCVRHNLQLLLKRSPTLDLTDSRDWTNLTDSSTNSVSCSSTLCVLLSPLLELLKPILNGVGGLVTTQLANVLGVEVGRTDVKVESISCGVPTLVQ